MEKNKNVKKYLSYKEAYSKMNNAIKLGFYLEAITIQESIISDRLLSFVIGKNIVRISENELHKSEVNFSNLLKKTKDFMSEYKTLPDELELFRKDRNTCVHLLVKSFPGKPTIDVLNFNSLARETSVKGKRLTRKVLEWHKTEKKKTNP